MSTPNGVIISELSRKDAMDADEIAGRFAGRLRELRSAKGWTQTQLAQEAGLARAGVANLEQGRREPSWGVVIRLCLALGVSCAEFQKPPADAESPGRGRPAKTTDDRTNRRRPKAKG